MYVLNSTERVQIILEKYYYGHNMYFAFFDSRTIDFLE